MMTSCAPMPFIRSNIPSPWRSNCPSTWSAGNLFGTTRTSQPGVFGALPFWRYAITSGGVSDSWPGQNGHPSFPSAVTRSKTKSLGRFCRSVEMMTQRPVTGSLRSSGKGKLEVRSQKSEVRSQKSEVEPEDSSPNSDDGVECVLIHLNGGPVRVQLDRDDVEAAGPVDQVVARRV